MGKVHNGVPRDGEGELGLPFTSALQADNGERRGIQNGREGAKPGLVFVMGAEKTEDRIRQVAFEQIGRPPFPFMKKLLKVFQTVIMAMPPEHLARRGRRACAGIEHGDIDFPPGEGLIQDRKVSDHEREKAEPHPGLKSDKPPAEGGLGQDVT